MYLLFFGLFFLTPLAWADEAPPERVDVNSCRFEELVTLHGIGPFLAQEILIDHSLKGDYLSLQDFTRVKGIGPVLAHRLKNAIRFGDAIPASGRSYPTYHAVPCSKMNNHDP